MKKTLLLAILLTCMLFSGCFPDDEPSPVQSAVVVFLIDYTTNTLESGSSTFSPSVDVVFTELPVTSDITEPTADLDGSVSLILTPTGEQIFNAGLSPEGDVDIFAPGFIASENFLMLSEELPYPSSLVVKDIDGPYQVPFETTWEAINRVNLVDLFRLDGALFGRFLYKPSEEVSENWKWVVIMYNQL